MSRVYFAIEFPHSKYTTTGTPNSTTGRMSIATVDRCFYTREERDDWVYEDAHRIAVTRRELRQYDYGCSVALFNECVDQMVRDTRGYS